MPWVPAQASADENMHTTDIEAIEHALAVNRGHFPEQAVRAAIRQREAVTPILLAALEAAADDPEGLQVGDAKMLHIYAMYLLAQFREKAAYPILVRFFSVPGELMLDLTGDLVTEDLRRILASVCDDDLAPIQRMIEDPAVNEYVRSACLKALVILVGEGRVPRERSRGLIDDAVVEMRGWACFRRPEAAPTPSDLIAATRPAVRGQKIGRNDPCPCGSGKKRYRRVSGYRDAAAARNARQELDPRRKRTGVGKSVKLIAGNI